MILSAGFSLLLAVHLCRTGSVQSTHNKQLPVVAKKDVTVDIHMRLTTVNPKQQSTGQGDQNCDSKVVVQLLGDTIICDFITTSNRLHISSPY